MRGWLIGLVLMALGGGCCCPVPRDRVAVDLGSLDCYICGDRTRTSDGKPGAGLAKTFRALSAMGYDGVIFDGYYGNDAKTLKSMLADSGLKVLASRVTAADCGEDKIAETCEFNLNYGNNLLLCDDLTAVESAARHGCVLARPDGSGRLRKNRENWRVLQVGSCTNGLHGALSAIRRLEME